MTESQRYHGTPELIYGTAFKADDTVHLVEAALKSGFRAIDTAGNRPQYREELVGEGIQASLNAGVCDRNDLWIQTKFSPYKAGRDPALYSYDTSKPIQDQVIESVNTSLTKLKVDYIDCLVLHSLYPNMADTLAAWKAMETLVPSRVSHLGLSNADVESMQAIWSEAVVKPISVQNRFTGDTSPRPDADMPPGIPYPKHPYDRDVRSFCNEHDIVYAPWGLLWGNPEIMETGPDSPLTAIATAIGVDRETAMYACMKEICLSKLSILCGTSQEGKMRDRMAGPVRLGEFVRTTENNQAKWKAFVQHVDRIVNAE